ncbi:MAG TPA: DUF6029 family protein [Candidatus Eisenbacteria bacterium]|nr:DUF6029 family protein [Candidatus Eisenbacteria bacterium]
MKTACRQVLVLGALGVLASAAPVAGQVRLPYGFSASYQTEYSRARTLGNRIFENWVDLDYTKSNVTAGLRFVAFQPPDPSVFSGQASKGVDLYYAEVDAKRIKARAGTFYSQFGRGLALRLYEDRPLRVDHNALGGIATWRLPQGEITGLWGKTVAGSAEDANRKRDEPVYGASFDHTIWAPAKLGVGGSWATTSVSDGTAPVSLRALNIGSARLSGTAKVVDLAGEAAFVEGPNVFPAVRKRVTGERFKGHGFYASATTSIKGLGLVLEGKDYDALVFQNNASKTLNLPPAVLKNHTFNLLNRHPHQLDAADERGFQFEATWVTKKLAMGETSLLYNAGLTRNHETHVYQNYVDDNYFEIQQEVGKALSLTAGISRQKVFATYDTPWNVFRTLWTPVADMRWRLNDVHSLHLQLEHQHDRSEFFGSFDVEFGVLEWSRSPGLTLGMLIEHTNKSDLQLERLVESRRNFVAGTIDYTLFGQHELRLFYGKRNKGFICVGGVCRLEPDFDGFEASLVSRF